MWPFRKKPAPLADMRVWNEDWKIGDTAECIVGQEDWHSSIKPWNCPAKGAQLIVTRFHEGPNLENTATFYFLHFDGISCGLSTQCFRKVRPIFTKQSAVVEQILTAKPGADKVRKTVKAKP